MSKSAYIGVDGFAHNVKKMYIGVDGVARKVKKAYIGVDGVARLFYASDNVATFLMTNSDSYAGSWSNFSDNDIRQGWTNGNRVRGCIWFDNATLRATLSNATIEEATLRLYSQDGVGRGTTVTVELYGTTKEYSGRSGLPDLAKTYGTVGTIDPDEVTTFTIPKQAVEDLASGAINGLMLYSSDTAAYDDKTYSRNYARFDGETSGSADTIPMLTVKYS